MRTPIINEAWNESQLIQNWKSESNPLCSWKKDRLRHFSLLGFPHRKMENWKYTSTALIAKEAFQRAVYPSKLENSAISPVPNAYVMVFMNGYFIEELSSTLDLPQGVELTSLQSYLVRSTADDFWMNETYQTPFSVLNDALFENGLRLFVPKNTHLQKPIHLIHLMNEEATHVMSTLRNHYILEENSSAVVFEEYIGVSDTPYFTNVVTQVQVQKNADLQHYKLQNEGKAAFHIADMSISQCENSGVRTYHFALGARLSRDDLNISLNEHHAHCELMGLYTSDGSRHVDNHTRIDHRVAHSASVQHYQGIMSDESRAVFNGKVIVHPNAQKTRAQQDNNNLLLSERAEVNTKPELEIYANDVQCTHGATVGQLSQEALLYLRTRGIERREAQYLLTVGFANKILSSLPDTALTQKIRDNVYHQLKREMN